MPRIGEASGPRTPWSLIIFGAMVAVLTVVWLVQLWRPMPFFADQALLEIATRDSLQLQQAVGAHSRLGGFHPGPAYTYLLAPLYWLTGEAPRSLLLGTFLINAGCLFAAVVLVRARLGEAVARWAAAAAALYLVMLGVANTWWLWNPNVLGPALVLTVLLVADCTRGRIGPLIWATVTGSFLVQAHVVMAVPVAGLLIVAAAAFTVAALARRRGREPASGPAPGSGPEPDCGCWPWALVRWSSSSSGCRRSWKNSVPGRGAETSRICSRWPPVKRHRRHRGCRPTRCESPSARCCGCCQ